MGNRLLPDSESTEVGLMGEGRGLQEIGGSLPRGVLGRDTICHRPLKFFLLLNFQTNFKGLLFPFLPAWFQPFLFCWLQLKSAGQ